MIELSMMQVLLYMISMFLVGAVGCTVLILWLFGSSARTIGFSHLKGNRIALYPTDEGTWQFKQIKEVDEKNRWQYETDDGRLRKLQVKRGDAKIEGGKCPMAVFPPDVAISTSPRDAYVADTAEKENLDEEKKVFTWNDSISFGTIKDNMKSILAPSALAGMMAQGIEMNKPLTAPEAEGMDHGTKMKLGGLGIVIVIIIVAIFVVMKMGII